MRKSVVLAVLLAGVLGGSVGAANPFSDVSSSDWAYQAVADLSDEGIVDGYPDGTFRGQKNVTRYELAQIVARLMAKEDEYSTSQRAIIEKLAYALADELDTMGVRVSTLESRIGNVLWSGDARMRMVQGYDREGKKDSAFDGRMRIRAHAEVNDSTYVEGRLRTDMDFMHTGEDDNSTDTYMDNLYVRHTFGDSTSLKLGKFDEFSGQTGLFYDGQVRGLEASYTANDNLQFTAGYGRFKDWGNVEVGYGRISGDNGSIAYNVEYYQGNGRVTVKDAFGKDTEDAVNELLAPYGVSAPALEVKDFARIWGGGLTLRADEDFSVFGDYYKNVKYEGKPVLWTAGFQWGHTDLNKPGTSRFSTQYVSAEDGSYIAGTTLDVSDVLDKSVGLGSINPDFLGITDDGYLIVEPILRGTSTEKLTFWLAKGDVVLTKNVNLHGEYAFHISAKDEDDHRDNLASVSLQYTF